MVGVGGRVRQIVPKLHEPSQIVDGIVTEQEIEFWFYHLDNSDVYHLFKAYTELAIRRGHTRLSPWLIINRIRWEQEVVIRTKENFKISNKFIAYYSRLWMIEHDKPDFFETRPVEGQWYDKDEGIVY